MKKILSIILSAVSAVLGIFLASCDNTREPQKSYAYYGVAQTLDGFEGLYIQIPDFGICELPTYEEGKTPNLTLEEGDLLGFYFYSEVQVTKSYPAIISTPARYVSVYEKNIGFEVTSEQYLLTIDYTKEIKDELLSYDLGVEDTIYFWRSEGVPGKSNGLFPSGGGRVRMEDYATATIKMIEGDRLTLGVSLEQDMQEFFKYYAHGDLEIHGKSIADTDGENNRLRNFFEIQDTLELTDFEKVEIITESGSVSPEYRNPTEHRTTQSQEDFELICEWLKSLNYHTIKDVKEEATFVEGGSSKIMTVWTKQGNFRIYELAGKYLKIWDRYFFIAGAKLPEFEGDSVTCKFDYSIAEKVGFYKWNQFSREYDFKISDLSFEKIKRNYNLPRIGYFLKTDVGVIELYSSKIFYHGGTGVYYEIVGEKDFSIIFETNPPPIEEELQNYALIKSIHAEHCEDPICKSNGSEYYGSIVSEYYGKYESGAIVALIYCGGADNSAVAWREIVAGHEFAYGDSNSITVFYNGDCYSLLEAYLNGYLTEDDIATIALKRKIFDYFALIE